LNLNEIGSELMKLEAELEQAELTEQAFIDTLESSTQMMAFEDKVEKTLYFIENMRVDTDTLDAKIKRLQARKKAREANIKWAKDRLQYWMEQTKRDTLKFPEFTVSIKKNPPALQVDEGAVIPAKYLTIIPEHTEINNADLKVDLKAGVKVTGCRLTAGKSLQIR